MEETTLQQVPKGRCKVLSGYGRYRQHVCSPFLKGFLLAHRIALLSAHQT